MLIYFGKEDVIKSTYATSCRLHIGNYKTLCLRTGASVYFLSLAIAF